MRALIAVAFLCLATIPALGAEAVDAGNSIVDLSPIIDPLFEALSVVLIGLATWLVERGLNYLGIMKQSELRTRLLDAAKNAAALGLSHAKETAISKSKVDVHNAAVAVGAKYLTDTMAETLKKLNAEGSVEQIVSAQIAKLEQAPSVTVEAAKA